MRRWVQWRWGEVWWVVWGLWELWVAGSQGSLDPKSNLERIDRYS
ncbi:hypothetical protein [Corynebacterium durum]|nr:hypothetical protein [Corynebacterium durum]